MVQKFRETAENYMNANFFDKNFVVAPIFRDSRCDTPTILKIPNFRDPKSNHENIVPRKFGAIYKLTVCGARTYIARAEMRGGGNIRLTGFCA